MKIGTMQVFETHLDEINAAVDMVLAFAPEVSDGVASRIVAAFYSAGYRITKLQPAKPTARAAGDGRGRKAKYEWAGMELGETRYFPEGPDMRNKLNASVRQFAAKHAADARYSVTKKDGRWAVARIA